MVDLSLVLDVSSSIGAQWSAVARRRADLHQLVRRGARSSWRCSRSATARKCSMRCRRAAASTRRRWSSDVPTTLPGGSTAMVEGLYRGWDELRSVPTGIAVGPPHHRALHRRRVQQRARRSTIRRRSPRALRTYDFPQNCRRHARPDLGLSARLRASTTRNRAPHRPSFDRRPRRSCGTAHSLLPAAAGGGAVPAGDELPHASSQRRASRPPFPLQTNALKVDGVPQSAARGLRDLSRRQVSQPGLEHQQRRAQPRRDHRQRGAQRHRRLQASASTPSAWASSCGSTSARGPKPPRAS